MRWISSKSSCGFRRDRSKPGFMAGPGCPPPPSRPGEGGRSGGPHGGSARGRPGSAAGHNRPAARRGRRRPRRAARRPRPPPPRGAGSHPPREERARSPSLAVQLQHGFRPPAASPGPRVTAQPPSRRPRAPGGPRALPTCAPLGTRRTLQTPARKVERAACGPSHLSR